MTDPRIAQVPESIIERAELLTTVGSTAHGVSISTDQGNPAADDLDVAGFYIPPPAEVFGLHISKSIVWRSKAEGVKSEPGDVDLVLHPLQKFVQLAYKGNPTILGVLYSPETHRITGIGAKLVLLRSSFLSQSAGDAFAGYAHQQYLRLRGERGQMSVKRPDLVEAHGYDTKYAAHVLRLCHQGTVMLTYGTIPMPIGGAERETILRVRNGEVPFDDVIEMIEAARAELDIARERSQLPKLPDREATDKLIVDLHVAAWGARDIVRRVAAAERRRQADIYAALVTRDA